jgi:Rrf2 family transcriptional regulator, cysteine metabolism repressor
VCVRFSARVSYGLRAASLLGERFGTRPVLGREISVAEALPAAYLEQIMAALRRADLVTGTRGVRGGYVLSRSPEEITLTQLVEALEGSIEVAECPGGPSCCGSPDTCSVREVFDEVDAAVVAVFDSRTLADLVRRREALRERASMYHI